MNTIKIYGSGCPACQKLESMCFNVLAENDIDMSVVKISDVQEMAKAGIFSTPGLEINGKIVAAGKLPTKETLLHWIKENLIKENETK
jgi:small redox-active disulfide protein 2